MKRIVTLLAATALFGCGLPGTQSEGEEQIAVPGDDRIPGVSSEVALQHFSGPAACQDAENYIEDGLVNRMRQELLRQKDYFHPGGCCWGPIGGGGSMDAGMSAPGGSVGSGSQGPSSSPGAVSGTNVQVQGVDEADLMKTDGQRIYVVAGGKLQIAKSWPAEDLALLSALAIDGYPTELFLAGNKAVVLSHASLPNIGSTAGLTVAGPYWGSATKVTVVDVANPAAPSVTRELWLPGSYVSSRRVDSAVRVVLNEYLSYPAGVQTWVSGPAADKAAHDALIDQQIVTNEALIRNAPLTEWLKSTRERFAGGAVVERSTSCEDLAFSNAVTQVGLASVVSFDLINHSRLDRETILAQVHEIYASASSLYLASHHWWWAFSPGQQDTTYLHKFDIANGNKATYRASGVVQGFAVDQFSFDEHNGKLRVALTANGADAGTRINRVVVLGEQGGKLQELGRTSDLAPGETIQSARFIGNRGFVVTFRQVDPLFTLDLSNPAHPTVVGELKVPGFSSYLHPVDENHLLGVGTYVNPNGGWMDRSVQLSLFDVTDLANPVQVSTTRVGSASSYSEAQWEHRAFSYLPEQGRFAMPFQDYGWGDGGYQYTTDLKVFSVSVDAGVAPLGSVPMSGTRPGYEYYDWDSVRRGVLADDVVYAVSNRRIKAARLPNLGAIVGQVQLQEANPYGGGGGCGGDGGCYVWDAGSGLDGGSPVWDGGWSECDAGACGGWTDGGPVECAVDGGCEAIDAGEAQDAGSPGGGGGEIDAG